MRASMMVTGLVLALAGLSCSEPPGESYGPLESERMEVDELPEWAQALVDRYLSSSEIRAVGRQTIYESEIYAVAFTAEDGVSGAMYFDIHQPWPELNAEIRENAATTSLEAFEGDAALEDHDPTIARRISRYLSHADVVDVELKQGEYQEQYHVRYTIGDIEGRLVCPGDPESTMVSIYER